MNIQQMMGLMQFVSQYKNGGAEQQINNLVSSGQVSNDMLNQAHQLAKPIYEAFRKIRK